jgi:hypothetical protein
VTHREDLDLITDRDVVRSLVARETNAVMSGGLGVGSWETSYHRLLGDGDQTNEQARARQSRTRHTPWKQRLHRADLARTLDKPNATAQYSAPPFWFRDAIRSIDGFSHMLLTDYAARLDDGGVGALKRIPSMLNEWVS